MKIAFLIILISFILLLFFQENLGKFIRNEFFCKGNFSGTVEKIIDGDTIKIKECEKSIRLALVNTPERYEKGYIEAKHFVEKLCNNTKAEIIQDTKQPYDKFGRIIAVVYCQGKNVNAELIYRNLSVINTKYCSSSIFAKEDWAWNYGCKNVLNR